MSELAKIAEAARALVESGRRGLLVTVVGTRGSTYRRAGARAVIADDGSACGSISGGCLEKDLAERFRTYANDFTPRLITYDSSRSDDIVFGLGLGCRGEMDVLVEPFDAAHPPRMPTYGTWTTELPDGRLFVETIRAPRRVALFGGGPDVEPVALLARASGFIVDVIAPREVHPEQVAEKVDLGVYDAAIVMTHNYLYDLALLRALLPSGLAYIGMLGPKKRGEELLGELGGVTAEQRERLHNPIGLDLGGDTPAEIALSIVAELQATLNGRSARPLRESDEPIHAGSAGVLCTYRGHGGQVAGDMVDTSR